MTADLRRLIADDAFAASFQTLGQYRAALLSAASQVLPDPEPSLLELLNGGWHYSDPELSSTSKIGFPLRQSNTEQLVDGRWWAPTCGDALQQVVNNARALWRKHNGAAQ